LGLAQVSPEEFLKRRSTVNAPEAGLGDAEIEQRIADRIAARTAKNWAESDRIRDELVTAGVILEDKPGGTTTWRRA
jgi:cysteinyl-tRNA synthetase